MSQRWGTGTFVIPAPLEVDAIMRKVPKGKLITINEIRADQPGADNDEYFELIGDASASLDGLTYLVIGDGSTSSITPLSKAAEAHRLVATNQVTGSVVLLPWEE